MRGDTNDDWCLLNEFLQQVGFERGVYYRRYESNPAYHEILGIRKDKDGRVWVRVSAIEILRRDYQSRKPHGNLGRTPTRECAFCDHLGHPRHKRCGACGRAYGTD